MTKQACSKAVGQIILNKNKEVFFYHFLFPMTIIGYKVEWFQKKLIQHGEKIQFRVRKLPGGLDVEEP